MHYAKILNVENSGEGTRVVLNEDTSTGGGGSGEQAITPPSIGFAVSEATVLDTGLQYVLSANLEVEGQAQSHVAPIDVTLTVNGTGTTAQEGINYSLQTQVTIAVGSTSADFTIQLIAPETGANTTLVLELSAVEQVAQEGFDVQTLDVTNGVFTLNINDDVGGDTELNFTSNRVNLTALDFGPTTLQLNADRPAPAGGITVTLAVPLAQQVEYAARVTQPQSVTIAQGETSVDVPFQGNANSSYSSPEPSVADNFLVELTDLPSGVVAGTQTPSVVVAVSDYPQGTRRLSWETSSSTTSENGQQITLQVTHQASQFTQSLSAEFTVQVAGTSTAFEGSDFTLAPAAGQVVTISGANTSATFTLSPEVSSELEGQEEAVLQLVAAAPDYQAGQVTLIEAASSTHVATILADEVPPTFTVQFDKPGYTYTSDTYTNAYAVGVTSSMPLSVDVQVFIEWTSATIDLSLFGTPPTLITIPAGDQQAEVARTPLASSAQAGTLGLSGFARGVITDVQVGQQAATPLVGTADAYVITAVGDLQDHVPDPPAVTGPLRFQIYNDRVERLPTPKTYFAPNGRWGQNDEQPFDDDDLVNQVRAFWEAANSNEPVALGGRGGQIVFELMQDVPGLILRIGNSYDGNRNIVKKGMTWVSSGTSTTNPGVALPVRDLVFFSSGTGSARKKLRSLEIYADEESMPFFDNIMCQSVMFTTPEETVPTLIDNAVRLTAWDRQSKQDHGTLWIDQCGFRDWFRSETQPNTFSNGQAVRRTQIYSELRCMPCVTSDAAGDDTDIGRAIDFIDWGNHSTGLAAVQKVTVAGQLFKLLVWSNQSYSGADSVMSVGLVAVVDCGNTNGAFGVPLTIESGVYGNVYILGGSYSVSQGGDFVGSSPQSNIPKLTLRGFQEPFNAQGNWYRFLFVELGPSASSAFEFGGFDPNIPFGGQGLIGLSSCYELSIGQFELVTQIITRGAFGFNAGMQFNDLVSGAGAWTWDGQRATAAPRFVPTRAGGVAFDPAIGDLLTYAGTSTSVAKHSHQQVTPFGNLSFPYSFSAYSVTSYDGTNFA